MRKLPYAKPLKLTVSVAAIAVVGCSTVGLANITGVMPAAHAQPAKSATLRASTPLSLVDLIYKSSAIIPLSDRPDITESLRAQLKNADNEGFLLHGDNTNISRIDYAEVYQKDNQALVDAAHVNQTGDVVYTASFKLLRENGAWKVDELAPSNARQFIANFYATMPELSTGYAGDNRLTTDFKERISGPQVANPFTLSQQQAVGFSFKAESLAKDKAVFTVTVQEYGYAHNVRAELLRGIGGVWHVNNVTNIE